MIEAALNRRSVRAWMRRVIRPAVLVFALTGAVALPGETDNPPPEIEVKAAFVLNFVRFVYWTNLPEEENTADLRICALANSDFADAVRRVAAGKMAGKRSISLRFEPTPTPSRCRVLILDAGDYRIAAPALSAVRNAPVLTIGNGPGLIPMGGMFELIVRDRKVQFDINLDAIHKANLDVSSRLLELSRNLKTAANRSH